MSPVRGRLGGAKCTSARVPHHASAIPRTPPSTASARLSPTNIRMMRDREAPSAARICDLAGTHRGPREQQIGNIRACNQQNEQHRTQQQIERGLHVSRKLVAQRHGNERLAAVRVRISNGQLRSQIIERACA